MALSDVNLSTESDEAMGRPPQQDAPRVEAGAHPASRGRIVLRTLRRTPRFWVGGITLAVLVLWAVIGPFFSPWTIYDLDGYNLNFPPTVLHWFGTDQLGHDLYTQSMEGLRKSLVIGFVAGPMATLLAAIIGATAGYLGGWGDKVIAWVIDLFLVLPTFFVLILLYPMTHGSWIVMTIFLGVTGWMIMAQVIRSQTRSLREREFVKAARYMGFSTWSVVTRHIIPNVASLLIIDATLGIAAMITAETTLSFFGFGVQTPDVSLGTLLSSGQAAAITRPWLFLFPAGILIALLLAISLVGDALRDAIDPTSGVNRG